MKVLVLAVALLGCASAANGAAWNVFDDWQDFAVTTNNPDNTWSFGYQTTLADPLVLFNDPRIPASDAGITQAWYTTDYPSGSPSIYVTPNNGPNDYYYFLSGGNVTINPGVGTNPPQGSQDPPVRGVYGTVRWTAPANGLYSVDALFEGNATKTWHGKWATSDVNVAVNGTSVFSGGIDGFVGGIPGAEPGGGPQPGQAYQHILSLTAGDNLDFAVGPGFDVNAGSGGDATRLQLTITSVPEPTTLWLMSMIALAIASRMRVRS
jgi:hypothetical protein